MSKEMQIPEHWQCSKMSVVCEKIQDGTHFSPPVSKQLAAGPYPYVTAKNVRPYGLDILNITYLAEAEHRQIYQRCDPRTGDVLLVKDGVNAGDAAINTYDGEISLLSSVSMLRPRQRMLTPRFLRFFLLSPQGSGQLKGQLTGTAIKRIILRKIREMYVPIAPLNEQRRIVSKIEELFSDLDAGVAALQRARANLKRYGASVLKAAVDGSLTAEWRAKHPNVEPAAKLLERILAERRQKWEADQLAKFAAAGKQPPKNWREKYVEPESPDTTNLPQVPKGWCWATLETVTDVVGGVTKDQKKENRVGMRNVQYLRVANVQRGFLDLSEIKSLAASEQDIAQLRLMAGDLLFTEGGDRDKLGRGWVWSDEIGECIHQNHIFRARLLSHDIQAKFISHHANTFGRDWFAKAGKQTTNLASINLRVLRRFPVPIPSPSEQTKIVAILDESLSLIAAAGQAIEHGLKRAARLRQSILKDAFEGRLVAQDPADEPASVLLARLQQPGKSSAIKVASEPHKPLKLPKDVFLRRASLVSYAVRRLHRSPNFGETQLMKVAYLTQTHLKVDLQFRFQRYQFGPFDSALYRLQATAGKKAWFVTKQRPSTRQGQRAKGVTYHPGTKIDDMCRYATGYLGHKQTDLDRLLDHIAGMNTDEAELFATAYAAWNDLIIDGRPAHDDAIVAEVHGWHPEKARFTPQMICSRLRWMRQHGYVPTGHGERTQLAGQGAKRKSRRGRAGP